MVLLDSALRRTVVSRAAVAGVALVVLAGCAAGSGSGEATPRSLELSDRPESVHGVREVTAVDVVRRIPGDNFGEADEEEHSVRAEVILVDDLSGDEAAAAAEAVLDLLGPEIARLAPDADPDQTSVSISLGSSAVQVGTGEDGSDDGVGDALADVVALHEAGATSVSLSVSTPQGSAPGQAQVDASPDSLVAIATVARDRKRPVDLSGGDAWYRSREAPDPAAVQLVLDASERPSVTSAQLAAPDEPLTVVIDAAVGDSARGDVVARWMTAYDGYPGRSGEPLAYVVEGTGGGPVEGWVGGKTPPRTTMPPFGDAEPWPADPGAPRCRARDLEVAYGGSDAAAGSRQASIVARNDSDRACAIEAVPAVTFVNAEGAVQADVNVKPFRPSMVPERVVVPSGERAMAVIDWQAMSTANDPDVTTALRVIALPGNGPVTIDLRRPDRSGALDILDGAEVRVSPWAQAAAG